MYEFSLGWFIAGFFVVIAGVAFVRFYQVVADNLGSGISDYDRYKLYAFITIGVGFLFMTNLHTFILRSLLGNIFGGGS